MRIKSLIFKALAAVTLLGGAAVSCSEVSFIEINPPADLQNKIDSVQHVKDSLAALLGDKQMIEIATGIVGAEDNTSAWWTEFSDYFKLPQGKRLVLEFYNFGKGVDNWNNFNICVASGERDSEGYTEFFVLRSDTYGWGNPDYNGALFKNDFPDVDGDGDIWNDFKTLMQGAYVTIEVDYAVAGTAFVFTTAVATDGTVLRQTYEQPVKGTELVAFLIADGSHMNMESAYLLPSQIQEIPDEMAVSIAVAGVPTALEIGSTDFWGKGEATVTFADGSVTVADTADINFVLPDLSTLGKKTILYSYSKTKQGNYGTPVAGSYTLEVTNPIVKIEAQADAYIIGGAKYVSVAPGGVKVVATYADETTSVLKPSQYVTSLAGFDAVFEAKEGTVKDAFSVKYYTASGDSLETSGILNIAKSALPAQTTVVGAEDNSSPFWGAHSQDWKVAPYETQAVSLKLGTTAAANWNAPVVVLRATDIATEYGVVRMDNYGWGAGYENNADLVLSSNWVWDTLLANLDGSSVSVSVTNNGDDTASVRYYVILANGEKHFQHYDGIKAPSSDLNFALTVDGCHLIFD